MSAITPLRIAHVVFSFDYGGLERRILRLIDGLRPYGAEFKIISLRSSSGQFLDKHPDVEHIVLGAKPGIDWRAILRLTNILRAASIDIVHSHNWVSMLEGTIAGRLAQVPVVVHGEHGASRFLPDQLKWQRTQVQRLLARASDSIIPVNESIRDRIVDVWGLPPSRCTVIRNGVDTDTYVPGSGHNRAPLVIGSISRLEHVKNFPCLIRATNYLNTSAGARRFKLVIVGEGSERSKLEAIIAELGAQDYVELAGATDNPETWYPQFDVYVNCSFSEGMSNTVLEAMSCGLPVVATNVPGHRDWLVEGENALFFASDDFRDLAGKIKFIADDVATCRRLQSQNRHYVVSDFSQNRFIANYRDHYSALLARRGRRWPLG